jgi:hypothetical protein
MEVLPTPESPTAISFIWFIYSPFYSDIPFIITNEEIYNRTISILQTQQTKNQPNRL